MSDNQARRLDRVQEALDAQLTAQQQADLRRELEADTDTATAASRLERVHQLLSAAPRERAPERLANRLMAQVAKMMTSQKRQKWPVPKSAIAAAIALANAATLPIMTGAAWLMIHAASRPELAKTVLPRVIITHLMMIEVMVEVLRQAESVAADDPDTAAAILRLLPDALRALSQAMDEDKK